MTEQKEDRSVHIYEEQKIPKRDPQDRKKDEEKRKRAEETKELFRQLKLKEAKILEDLGTGRGNDTSAGEGPEKTAGVRADMRVRRSEADRDERSRIRRNYHGRGFDMVWKGSPERLGRDFCSKALSYQNETDDFEYQGNFSAYFPTYDDMSHDTLRGYFSWRTQVRQGIFNEAPLSFVFVHIYELLEKIGADTPEDGFRQLMELRENYTGKKKPAGGGNLKDLLDRWLCDYVVYYGLGEKYASQVFGKLRARDLDAAVIKDPDEHAPEDVMRAVARFSSYNLERSAFMRERPDLAAPVIRKVWKSCLEIFKASGGSYIIDSIVGTPGRKYYQIFNSAVFYDYKRYKHLEYKVDDTRTIICTDGRWSVDCTGDSRGTVNTSPVLGQIMHETDRKLRESFGYAHKLIKRPVSGDFEKIIDQAISEYKEEREKALRPVVNIDTSKLDVIRNDADYTAGRLLEASDDDEELYDDHGSGGQGSSGVEIDLKDHDDTPYEGHEEEALSGSSDLAQSLFDLDENDLYEDDDEPEEDISELLDDTELAFLRCLLDGKPYDELLKKADIFPSIMAESVNEKLFDIFSDNVIEEDENGRLCVVEDYAGDLEDML